MKAMIIGQGGREHALAQKISQNREVSKIYAMPGNGGISEIAECISLKSASVGALADFAQNKKIDLTIVGPELHLFFGLVDEFQRRRLNIFGPTRQASKIEWSKAYAKEFMEDNNIPTAPFKVFTNAQFARDYINLINSFPVVIKKDGLTAGKGVYICHNFDEAEETLSNLFGSEIVIEDFIDGEELSFIAFTDGETILPLLLSRDYKPAYIGGPNTGGMGTYAPVEIDNQLYQRIMDRIMYPTLEGLKRRKIDYQGILYAGLMIKDNNPYVLEFNARFGDPETQPLMMLLETDLIYIIQKTLEKRLHQVKLEWQTKFATCVVLASAGYPNKNIEYGKEIYGLDGINQISDVIVFHAGTMRKGDKILTNSGRVLGITGLGRTLAESVSKTYSAINKVNFDGMWYREDIGLIR